MRFPSSPSAVVLQQQPLLPPLTNPDEGDPSLSSSPSSPSSPTCLPTNPAAAPPKAGQQPAAPPFRYTPSPVQPIVLGEWFTASIEPMHFWRASLDIEPKPSHGLPEYQMNLTFVDRSGAQATEPPGSKNVAVYGRMGQNPTITTYDWVHIVTETGEQRRSVNSIAWEEEEEEKKKKQRNGYGRRETRSTLGTGKQ